MGTLYVVATPIGNREDITLRALRILREVAWVAAEDTRTSGRLLKHYQIEQRFISLHEHNEEQRVQRILDLLDAGDDIALISDAGTPLLSDPGLLLVQAASAAGHNVVPVPGASALLAALSVAALPSHAFTFVGFPPRKAAARQAFLESYAGRSETLILYESPKRLPALLADVQKIMGADRPVVVARELTKRYETIWRGTAQQAVQAFPEAPPGEVVVLVGGASTPPPRDMTLALQAVSALQAGGMSLSQAVRMISELADIPRRALYQQALQAQKRDAGPQTGKS